MTISRPLLKLSVIQKLAAGVLAIGTIVGGLLAYSPSWLLTWHVDGRQIPETIVVEGNAYEVRKDSAEIVLIFSTIVDSNLINVVAGTEGNLERVIEEQERAIKGAICARLSNTQILRDYDETAKQYRHAELARRHNANTAGGVKTKEIEEKLSAERRQFEWAKKESDLADTLLNKGFISEHDHFQVKNKYAAAERQLKQSEKNALLEIDKATVETQDVVATLDSLKERLATAKSKVDALTIPCPISGVIEVGAKSGRGHKVNEGEILMKIRAEKRPVVLRIDISQNIRQFLRLGQRVKIYSMLDEPRTSGWLASIESIASIKKTPQEEGDNGATVFQAMIFPDDQFHIPLGEIVLVEIPLEYNGVTLNNEYVANDGMNYFVYVIKGGESASVAKRRLIVATPIRNGFVVKSGIVAGERLAPIPPSVYERAVRPKNIIEGRNNLQRRGTDN